MFEFFGMKRRRYVNKSNPMPWTEDLKWQPSLYIQGETYHQPQLFDVKPCKTTNPKTLDKDNYYKDSPSGTWRYTNVTLPKETILDTWNGSRVGSVAFTTDVIIPSIYELDKQHFGSGSLWMSLTPAEIFAMKQGVRFAKGHTLVAGLGLGYLLRLVDQKKTVKKITLVEISQELIDWVLPQLKLTKPIEVICGDAKKIVPQMDGLDRILTDIDSSYGNNKFPVCKAQTWTWGTAYIP